MNINIMDYGAVGDGTTLSTTAIQRAIDTAAQTGGRVEIPSGIFLSGTLRLRSHVELYLAHGAVLRSSIRQEDMVDFTKEFDEQDDNEDTGWEGGCFLLARHEKDIAITGSGTIDGQGREVFYDDNSDGGYHECPLAVKGFRPRLSFLEDVDGLTVRGVTFFDAAFWTLHMAGCKNVLIDGIRILNNERGPNNDGIDPDCCKNVVIRGCVIRAGDDSIVLKTTLPMARKYGECSNIVISDCVMHSHSSALKIGTETHADIHHVAMNNCILEDCTRGIGIWSRDGGGIHDITISHITGSTRGYSSSALRKNGVVVWWGAGEPVFVSTAKRTGVDRIPGSVDRVYMDHLYMKCEGAITIAGEKESPIRNLEISESVFTFTPQSGHRPVYIDETPSVRGLKKMEKLPCVYIRSCENVSVKAGLLVDEAFKQVFTGEILEDRSGAE
ncbi:MAG: glycoside hydrolase family 28 protein [Lachnospiraceae bacterium]|nr:glycoside hydrolase family 28 protein [Lachnospiraceae bacterium]